MTRPLREIIYITEEEMWQMKRKSTKNLRGVPAYYSVDRNGRVDFYPQIDTAKMVLYVMLEQEL